MITLDLEDSHKESKFNLHLRFENNSFSGINTAWRKFDSRISTSPVIIHKSSTPMHTEALTHQLVQSYFEEIENQLFKSKSLKKKILDELEITSSRFLTNP